MTNKLVKFQLLLTAFLTPLTGAFGGYGYEQAKVLLFIVLTSLSGFLWFLVRPILKWRGISIVAGLFIIILFITSITGLEVQTSFLGTDPYFQGLLVYAYLFLFSLMVSTSKIKFYTWIFCLTGSATIVGLLAIGDWIQIHLLGHQLPTYAGRVVSSFGQPNFYAGFILLSLPFTYYLLVNTKTRLNLYMIYFVLLVEIFAIVISESRTAFLLLVFLSFILLMGKVKAWFFITFITVIIIIISTLVSGYFSSGILSGEILNLKLENNPDLTKKSVEKRPYIWAVALEIFKKEPFKGFGLENISLAYLNYFTENKHPLFEENLKISPVLISLKDLNIDRTHNYLLDILLFSGILGLISWLLVNLMLIKKLIRSKVNLENSVLLIGFIVYLIWIQFQNQSIVHLIYFWLLVGLVDKAGIDRLDK